MSPRARPGSRRASRRHTSVTSSDEVTEVSQDEAMSRTAEGSFAGTVVGIDVGAAALHCVALDRDGRVAGARVVSAADVRDLPRLLAGAAVVALDAPAAPSTLPHRDDASLAPKFRAARCAEVAL